MTISGTSTLHDWTSKVNTVTGNGDIVFENSQLKKISALSVSIPVTSIESPKGRVMDSKTYDALKSEEFPNITFKLASVTSIQPIQNGVTVKVSGYLTIAGSKKLIDLYVTGTYLGNNGIQFKGSKSFKMTDFDIDPPTALLGTLHTGDEVTIDFSVNLETTNSSAFR